MREITAVALVLWAAAFPVLAGAGTQAEPDGDLARIEKWMLAQKALRTASLAVSCDGAANKRLAQAILVAEIPSSSGSRSAREVAFRFEGCDFFPEQNGDEAGSLPASSVLHYRADSAPDLLLVIDRSAGSTETRLSLRDKSQGWEQVGRVDVAEILKGSLSEVTLTPPGPPIGANFGAYIQVRFKFLDARPPLGP